MPDPLPTSSLFQQELKVKGLRYIGTAELEHKRVDELESWLL